MLKTHTLALLDRFAHVGREEMQLSASACERQGAMSDHVEGGHVNHLAAIPCPRIIHWPGRVAAIRPASATDGARSRPEALLTRTSFPYGPFFCRASCPAIAAKNASFWPTDRTMVACSICYCSCQASLPAPPCAQTQKRAIRAFGFW